MLNENGMLISTLYTLYENIFYENIELKFVTFLK